MKNRTQYAEFVFILFVCWIPNWFRIFLKFSLKAFIKNFWYVNKNEMIKIWKKIYLRVCERVTYIVSAKWRNWYISPLHRKVNKNFNSVFSNIEVLLTTCRRIWNYESNSMLKIQEKCSYNSILKIFLPYSYDITLDIVFHIIVCQSWIKYWGVDIPQSCFWALYNYTEINPG